MDHLSTARATLHAALVPILAQGRVHLYPPAQIVSPAIFLETSAGSLQTFGNAQLMVASFPVRVVADGDTLVQSETVDALIAAVHDRARTVPNASVTGWSAGPMDVGGANQRAATITVEIPITARTLCDPPIIQQ